MNDLISRLRLLEDDHDPDGYPAVRMKDITALVDACEALMAEMQQLRRDHREEVVATLKVSEILPNEKPGVK